ncbi:hypothetical protein [Mycoplasma crocodyli]|uniref:hypothetical protein n=1 Tax=Mycoplasma crocodyli TaxID=50052 RepID=UPI0002EE3A3C|nr:hypothetical protein [Mycoplasma crocodyli]
MEIDFNNIPSKQLSETSKKNREIVEFNKKVYDYTSSKYGANIIKFNTKDNKTFNLDVNNNKLEELKQLGFNHILILTGLFSEEIFRNILFQKFQDNDFGFKYKIDSILDVRIKSVNYKEGTPELLWHTLTKLMKHRYNNIISWSWFSNVLFI